MCSLCVYDAKKHIDHVKTQIPYAAICGITSAIMYLILGYYSFWQLTNRWEKKIIQISLAQLEKT